MSPPGNSKQRAAGPTAAAQLSAAQHSKQRPRATQGRRQPAAAATEPRKRPRRSSAAQQQPVLDLDLDGLGLEQLGDGESEYDPDNSSEDELADAVLADLDDFDGINDDSDQDEAPRKRSRRGATGSAR
jgi:hypothetical protein